jgi:hypothetical protein
MGKRHYKGNNKSEGKKQRQEKADAWRAIPEGDKARDTRSTNNNSYVSNNRGNWGLSVFSDVENKRSDGCVSADTAQQSRNHLNRSEHRSRAWEHREGRCRRATRV